MLKLKEKIRNYLFENIKDRYLVSETDLETTYPPQPAMGDLSFTFPFNLAKQMKANPRQVAQEMIPFLLDFPGVQKVEVAGPGYINVFLDKSRIFRDLLHNVNKTDLSPEERKIVVEHTNINPNKAAHIGHLRNACLGDTLCRCLKYKGENVEIQNYIDDTGVQVVDVVFGLMELEKKTLPDLEEIRDKFDYYCWDLYTKTSAYLAGRPEAQERKTEILRRVEKGIPPESDLARYISLRILRAHLATMNRIGVAYDILPCESSILWLKFWDRAFSLLRDKEGIQFVSDGPNSGCWVMRLEEDVEKEKIIVRSDGTVTYVGKDIAYQLWKFGLLGKDFYYEPFLEEDGRATWITTSRPTLEAPRFGQASKVYNVIDTRQSYLQKIVVQGLRVLKYLEQAEKSVHFSYEMVALSPKSLKELNVVVSEEEKERSFLGVSGRKGLGVKADDLIDRLEEKALAEVEKRNPDFSADRKTAIARQIACGALRYFMLKFARNSLIIFDFDEALNFEGETGPYLQYTLVRLNSIFRKLQEREGMSEEDVLALAQAGEIPLDAITDKERDDLWVVVLYAARLDEYVLHSVYSLEFSHVAKFAFNLCQKTNAYYHVYSILSEEDKRKKQLRIMTIYYIRETLRKALDLMGIPLPERM